VKIVIAPDSFKESLDALSVAHAIRDGLADVWPDADYVLKPMADGGEGTVEAVIASTGAQRLSREVRGPLGDVVNAAWAWHADTATATLEIAEASGLMRVPPDRRDAAQADSYGTGELMRAALDKGARRIVRLACAFSMLREMPCLPADWRWAHCIGSSSTTSTHDCATLN
jgi:glycerate kinase